MITYRDAHKIVVSGFQTLYKPGYVFYYYLCKIYICVQQVAYFDQFSSNSVNTLLIA